ncbi:hypothetical protein C6503_20505 [Candidatus Poribacteria bacterium]|nr:MAG: hypothetical protein C6503_20505 [Candidatus Poribacteria bacterium]
MQRFIPHFLQQETRESLIEGILEILEARFDVRDVPKLASALHRIDSEQRLQELLREAFQTPSLEAFQQTLGLIVTVRGLIVTTNGNDSR